METIKINQEEQKILYELKSIYDRHKVLERYKSKFNVFKLLMDPYDEVHLHSKMIYGILTEEKYKKLFLLSLLNILEILPDKSIGTSNIKNINVEREKKFSHGRIDIFISFEMNQLQYNIILENKLWALDQNKQLDRYLEFVSRHNKNGQNYVLYLTLDGHEPSCESCSDIEKIKLISYQDHILKWLENCIKIAARENALREILIQYEELIEKITGKDSGLSMELKDFILENSENFNFANSIKPALIEAEVELQLKFWKKLEEKLKIHLKENWDIDYQDVNENSKLGKYNSIYSRDTISGYYQGTRGSTYYGILYKICDLDQVGPIYLKIEISRDSLYFGIRKQVESLDEESARYQDLLNKLSSTYVIRDKEWWVGWKYLLLDDKKINLLEIDKDFAEILIDDNKLDKFVDHCIEQIDDLIEIVLSVWDIKFICICF